VFVGSNDNYLYALDRETGTKLFSFKTKEIIFSSPAIDGDGIVYIACNSETGGSGGRGIGAVYAINPFKQLTSQPEIHLHHDFRHEALRR